MKNNEEKNGHSTDFPVIETLVDQKIISQFEEIGTSRQANNYTVCCGTVSKAIMTHGNQRGIYNEVRFFCITGTRNFRSRIVLITYW